MLTVNRKLTQSPDILEFMKRLEGCVGVEITLNKNLMKVNDIWIVLPEPASKERH